MELGISTFGELNPDHKKGGAVNAHKRMQELLEEIKLADEVGLDVFAVGEHHREDYLVSVPEMVLAAGATITKNIRLSSAVTVLSSSDPVRIFQNYATLDLVSGGRAEIMAGRGSFIESFPVFGKDLNHYDELFAEHLDLLLKLNNSEKITWKGKFRPALHDVGIYPRPLQEEIPVWLAVGGTPSSAIRAAKLNLPMTLAFIGGTPDRFVSFANLYKEHSKAANHAVDKTRFALNTHFYAADSSQQALEEFFKPYITVMNGIGRERGWSPMGWDHYEFMRDHGPLMVGSPEQITEKILLFHEMFGNTRYLAQLMTGTSMPHAKTLHAIELFGTKIAPAVRKALQNK